MKKLLTTAMVLVMIATMFCISPVVMATENPEMVLSLFNNNGGNDKIFASFSGVKDASWVVLSITDKLTDEFVYIGEKRGNRAHTEGISFDVDPANRAILEDKEYIAEARITLQDGSVVTCSKTFKYNTFADASAIIGEMLAETKSIELASEELIWPLPDYYVSDAAVDNAIITALGSPSLTDLETVYNDLIDKMLLASLNSGNASVIGNIIESHFDKLSISIIDTEKLWYDSLADKNSIATKLANYTYGSIADFKNQFQTVVFLAKLSLTALDERLEFMETNNGNYKNYNTETYLNGVFTTTTLDFDTANTGYNALAITTDHEAYAAQYMSGSFESLNALETKFAQLLVALAAYAPPSQPEIVPESPSTNSSPAVSVGSTTPVAGTTPVPFTDIESVEWAKEAIIALANEGVINGVAPRQYQPNASVTREQFVKIIVNTFGLKGSGKVSGFEDVNNDEWYATYINTAVELGIINGVSNMEFGVGQNITRQDMTVIMYRVAKYMGIDVLAKSDRTFRDAEDIDSYAIEGVTALYKAGIVNGVADGVFGGAQTATRAQAAKLCYDLRNVK